jgi:hypothetical protein
VRPIGDAFFDQRPESFRRIQLWRVGRQAHQRQALRDAQSFSAMCGRPIQDQDDAFAGDGVRTCELIEKQLHHLGIQVWQYEPEDAPRPRMSRRIEPEPFVARVNDGLGTLASRRPHSA